MAVRTARHLAGGITDAIGDEDLGLAVSLLVSEVVTNAIRHTGAAERVRVRANGARVRVEVFDRGADLFEPRPRAADEMFPERRRGLQLLDTLSDGWGVEPTSAGKCIWFEISAGSTGLSAAPCSTEVPDGPAA
jgi:anti-sigma regulatory factor (Ser/Thr protein kinase)